MKKDDLSSYLIILFVIYSLSLSVRTVPPDYIDATALSSSEGAFISNPGAVTQSPTRVTSAGDINGDGHEDLLIGAYLSEVNLVSTGLAYIVFGTAMGIPNIDFDSMTTSQGIRINGAFNSANLGFAVEGVGDVSGDGIDDVMVGCVGISTVFVIFGKKAGLTDFDILNFGSTQGMKIEGDSFFGYAIKNVGDVNSDGINDIMISAPLQSTPSLSYAGEVYVIFGKSSGFSSMTYSDLSTLGSTGRGFKITGGTTSTYLGLSLNRAGDVNQDGVADMMIGTLLSPCSSANPQCGSVFIVYGSRNNVMPDIEVETMTLAQGFKIIGGISDAPIGFPYTIMPTGDCNNDGLDDLILGIYSFSDLSGNGNVGLVYVIYGKAGGHTSNIDLATLSSAQGYTIKGKAAEAYLGNSLSTGDIDGDGVLDLILVSTGGNIPEPQHGIIYIFFGGLNQSTDIDFANEASIPLRLFKVLVDGQFPSPNNLGTMVDIANDLNGDGVNDIICTATSGMYVIYGSKCERDTQCSSLSPLCYAARGCKCEESNLFFQAGECVSQCSPQGYYLNTPICESCPDSCSTCTSFSECQTCTANFLLQGGSCVAACSEGYYQDGSTCKPGFPVPNDIQAINSITNITGTFDSTTLTVASVVAPQDPGSVTAGMLTKMLQYLRYLDIPYSERLEHTFKFHNSTYGPFGIGPKFPRETLSRLPMHPIPSRFRKFHVHSSFLVNFWDSLIFIAIILCCFVLFKLVESSIVKFKQNPGSNPLVRKIRAAMQNFFFMQFYNIFGDVLLFLTFDLKTLSLDSRETILSFCLSVIFLCIGLIVIGIHIYILLRFHLLRKKASWISRIEGLYKIYEGSEVFFKHFKNKTIFSQGYLFLFVIRSCLFNLILALLFEHPLIQAMLILTLTLILLGYLLILRPFTSKVNLLQQILCELLFLIVNTCVFIITQLDLENDRSFETRDKLCDVIIYISLVFTFVPQVFLVLKIVIAVIEWYHARKKPLRTNKAQAPGIKVSKRLHNEAPQLQSPSPRQYPNQSLNDSSAVLSEFRNSHLSMHTNDSYPMNLIIRDDSPFSTNQQRRKKIKRTSQMTTQNVLDISSRNF